MSRALPFAVEGRVSLRMLEGAADLALVQKWLSNPLVLEWYEGRDKPHDAAMVLAKYGPGGEHERDGVSQAIIQLDDTPIGYVQFYPVGAWAPDYEIEDATGAWAIDIFIGEPGEWGRGTGTAALRGLLRHLFEALDAVRVLIDPRVANERAIRSYEKAGFRKVKILEGHEEHEGAVWDNWLMEIQRP